ncbi:hypothetical protein WMF38_57480 [Sorangium sp. So ce118]
MHRYVKVMGRSDLLVANPHAVGSDPPRFAGQRRKSGEVEDAAGLIDFYEPVEEVILWDNHVQTAIDKRELVQVGDRVVAKNVDDATKKLAKAKPAKGGE